MSSVPNKSSFKKRPKKPQATLKSKFENAVYKIIGNFLETDVFKHSLTKGEERENPLIEFLTENLPNIFSVVPGEVVDIKNSCSQQIDVMVYDNSRSIPFYSGNNYILPAEALLASIEVKSKLTQEETRKILKSVKTLKSLKPFNSPVDISKKRRPIEDKVSCRYFHCVFAYDTDFSNDNWLQKEFDRVNRIAREEKIDPTLIDRIFVMNKGLINTADSVGKETADNAESFLYFYMNLLNFLQRENGRRQSVPYIDYAGKQSAGWQKI